MKSKFYAPCDHLCMRGSDVDIWVEGDPVAFAHPGCPVHGWCEEYVPSGQVHGCGLKPCLDCKAYEDDHNYKKEDNG